MRISDWSSDVCSSDLKSLMRSREPKRQLVEPVATRRQDRRKAILDAAESLFLDQGFDRVSLAAVVGQSGGSLATLYELFGNKQGLLRAVIERGEQERRANLDYRTQEALTVNKKIEE